MYALHEEFQPGMIESTSALVAREQQFETWPILLIAKEGAENQLLALKGIMFTVSMTRN